VGRFLRDLPTLWQDGDTGGGSEGITDMMPAMTVVDDWLSEKAIMLYGQPEQVRRLIAQRFADIISMRRVVVCTVPGARQGAGEPGAQLGDEQAEQAFFAHPDVVWRTQAHRQASRSLCYPDGGAISTREDDFAILST